ncbi:AsmA family protein [Shimia marina]|uniref:Putative assembly protein n=1 Tax=Shimia marina TaxID=321267 RepID=A0A0P1ERZ3_9RHOB|nr:AsmA family protein [Shimia marina]CUH53158.1 putative assembly protein [Shimia marina]SFD83358.1 AsmA protein [Shimia marina]
MKLIRGLIGAFVVLLIGAVVLVVALPGEKLAKLAADQVKAQTGRELSFGGPVGISWYPVLGISAEDVQFANAPWSDLGPMFSAKKAVIGVDVMAALSGAVRIKNIELDAPDVLLQKNAEGAVNWTLSGVSADAPAPSPDAESTESGGVALQDFALERFVMKDARVRYLEHGGTRHEFSGLSMQMRWPSHDKAADVTLQAAPFGRAIEMEASVAAPLDLLRGQLSSVAITLTSAGGSAGFDGRFGLTPEASGQLRLAAPDAAAFFAALGTTGPEGPVAASGNVTLTGAGQFSLRGGTLEALGNALTVQADVDLAVTPPYVKAQVATNRLAFASSETGEAAQTSSAGEGGWSTDEINASALGLVNGTVSFAAESMSFDGVEVGRTRATVEIDRARAVVTIAEMAAYDGTVGGTFVANNRGGLSVRGDLTVRQIALQPFLTATADVDSFTGKADLNTRFLSSGQSLDALMNGLSGDGTIRIGRGTIEGIDLDRLLRGDVTGGTTVFDTMSASWTISDGVLLNEDLAMSLPRLAATGKGTVGLGLRTIDYLFTPQLKGSEGAAVIVPVKIRGSWDNPSIVPDLEAAIKGSFDEELKAVEDDAVKALEKELGLEAKEGQSTEDALKDKLENEAKKGLLKLLGGGN